jgi:hypothetical protein
MPDRQNAHYLRANFFPNLQPMVRDGLFTVIVVGLDLSSVAVAEAIVFWH